MSDLDWLLAHQETSSAYYYFAIPDYEHLRRLVDAWPDDQHPVRRLLAAKLQRAVRCGPEPLHDVVTMGSLVEFRREQHGAVETATLVYPDDLPKPEAALAVTKPLGALLLGMREHQFLHHPAPDEKPFFLRVERVRRPAEARPADAAAGREMALP